MKTARVIVCGPVTFDDYPLMEKTLDRLLVKMNDVTVLTDARKGAARLAERWAHYWWWTQMRYHPDEKKYGKKACDYRNQEMVEAATHFVAFHDGRCVQTADLMYRAKKWNLKRRIVTLEG